VSSLSFSRCRRDGDEATGTKRTTTSKTTQKRSASNSQPTIPIIESTSSSTGRHSTTSIVKVIESNLPKRSRKRRFSSELFHIHSKPPIPSFHDFSELERLEREFFSCSSDEDDDKDKKKLTQNKLTDNKTSNASLNSISDVSNEIQILRPISMNYNDKNEQNCSNSSQFVESICTDDDHNGDGDNDDGDDDFNTILNHQPIFHNSSIGDSKECRSKDNELTFVPKLINSSSIQNFEANTEDYVPNSFAGTSDEIEGFVIEDSTIHLASVQLNEANVSGDTSRPTKEERINFVAVDDKIDSSRISHPKKTCSDILKLKTMNQSTSISDKSKTVLQMDCCSTDDYTPANIQQENLENRSRKLVPGSLKTKTAKSTGICPIDDSKCQITSVENQSKCTSPVVDPFKEEPSSTSNMSILNSIPSHENGLLETFTSSTAAIATESLKSMVYECLRSVDPSKTTLREIIRLVQSNLNINRITRDQKSIIKSCVINELQNQTASPEKEHKLDLPMNSKDTSNIPVDFEKTSNINETSNVVNNSTIRIETSAIDIHNDAAGTKEGRNETSTGQTEDMTSTKQLEKTSKLGRSKCSLCSKCPCTFNSRDSSGSSFLGFDTMSKSASEIERALIKRLQKLEMTADRYDEQREAVRRRLVMHRREMWKKWEQANGISCRENRLSKKMKGYSRFLPVAEQIEQQLGNDRSKENRFSKSTILKAQRNVFASTSIFQPTLTQMIGVEKSTGEDSDLCSRHCDIDATSPRVSVSSLHSSDDDRDAHSEDDQSVLSTMKAKRVEICETSSRRADDFAYLDSQSVWASIQSSSFQCSFDRLFFEDDNAETGVDHLLELLGREDVNTTENSNFVDPETHTTSPSHYGQCTVERIIASVCAEPHREASIVAACPQWKENVSYAFCQKDQQEVTDALLNIQKSRVQLQQAKKALYKRINQQESVFDLFEDTLEQSKAQLQQKVMTNFETIPMESMVTTSDYIHNPISELKPTLTT
jgi:DEK C terminal domain